MTTDKAETEIPLNRVNPYAILFNDGRMVAANGNSLLAMYLAFNHSNKDSALYISIKNALPRIKGLKSERTRAKFAYDLVNKLNEK